MVLLSTSPQLIASLTNIHKSLGKCWSPSILNASCDPFSFSLLFHPPTLSFTHLQAGVFMLRSGICSPFMDIGCYHQKYRRYFRRCDPSHPSLFRCLALPSIVAYAHRTYIGSYRIFILWIFFKLIFRLLLWYYRRIRQRTFNWGIPTRFCCGFLGG